MSELATAAAKLREWRVNPVQMVREAFGEEPDPWQQQVLMDFADPSKQRMAMKACKGPGKTTVEAWCGLNFIATRPFPKIACTAVTKPNLRDNLWAEFSKWINRSAFFSSAFTWTSERIFANDHPEEWWISARAWSRDADSERQADTLAGLHADYILFILDEAGGIPDAVASAAEGGLSVGTEMRLLIGGNPTHLEGPLYRACTSDRKYWTVYEITGDPNDPNRAPRVSATWAQEQIDRYGEADSTVQIMVFGNFPTSATDALVPMALFDDAFNRWHDGARLAVAPKIIGVDVARYGADRTVLCFRCGDRIVAFEDWQGQDTVYSRKRIQESQEEFGAEEIRVDDVGVGGGLVDQLQEHELPAVGINVGEAPLDPTKHLNLRSELNLAMQSRFREGLIAIAPEVRDETTLLYEGTTLKVAYSTGTRRKIESKDEYKKRTGKSPDFWDAAVLAFADLTSHAGLMAHAAAEVKRFAERKKKDAETRAATEGSGQPIRIGRGVRWPGRW